MTKTHPSAAHDMRCHLNSLLDRYLKDTGGMVDQLSDLLYGDQSLSSAEHSEVADAVDAMLKARVQVMLSIQRLRVHAQQEAAQ